MTDLQIIASRAPAVDRPARQVSGLVVPWGVPGHTSAGPVSVEKGAITLPADLGRVKLLRDHSDKPGFTPVGFATAARVTEEGLEMDFKVGSTPDGDSALNDVTEGIRDALSVELIDARVHAGTLESASLTAVALVPIPAFADARVTAVTASRAADTDEPEDDEGKEDQQKATDHHDAEENFATETEEETMTDTPETPPASEKTTAARAPRGLITGPGHSQLTFAQAVEAIAAHRSGVESPTITAALADITRSANPTVSGPAWLGEMWSGVEYQREIVPTFTQKTLTAMKGIGWRWKDRPEVDDYAGDKAEIPTNTVTTEPVEVTAQRMAAGHDIDRAYFDFNETEFLSSFFTARANDYALKTDAKAAQFALDSAETGTEIAAEPDLLHAAARARLTIKRQTRVEPSAYLVNPDSLFGLFQITQLDNPAYLDLLGVKPDRFIASDLIPAGQMVAYAQQAMTWFELPGSPIRVDAERIDHGGKDSGVFGYWAALLNNQNGVVKVPFGEQPDSEPAQGAEA